MQTDEKAPRVAREVPTWMPETGGPAAAPMGYCGMCGGRNVQCEYWVGVNNGRVVSDCGSEYYWCDDCGDHGEGLLWERREAAERRLEARKERRTA